MAAWFCCVGNDHVFGTSGGATPVATGHPLASETALVALFDRAVGRIVSLGGNGRFGGDYAGSGRLSPSVPVMKTTQPRHRDHLMCWRRPRLHRSSIGRVLVEGIVNPILTMIGDVFADQPAQMGFIQRNDVIEKLPAAASDPSFRDSILPRRLDPRPLYFQPGRLQEIRNSSIELRVMVENDITAAHSVRESLAELL